MFNTSTRAFTFRRSLSARAWTSFSHLTDLAQLELHYQPCPDFQAQQ